MTFFRTKVGSNWSFTIYKLNFHILFGCNFWSINYQHVWIKLPLWLFFSITKLRHPSNVKNVSSGIEVNETISVRQTCRGNNVKNEPLVTKITLKLTTHLWTSFRPTCASWGWFPTVGIRPNSPKMKANNPRWKKASLEDLPHTCSPIPHGVAAD